MKKITDYLSSIRLPITGKPPYIDKETLLGTTSALAAIIVVNFLMNATKGSDHSSIIGLLILALALSPLFVAHKVEKETGLKLFTDFKDFYIATAWCPLAILAGLLGRSQALFLFVLFCGFFIDPLVLGENRARLPPHIRFMISYARVLSGIIGTILAVTVVGKLMDIGNPKSDKTVMQGIMGTVLWGMLGKWFFDYIGVTKPIDMSGLFRRKGTP
jgi:hypothetical protein